MTVQQKDLAILEQSMSHVSIFAGENTVPIEVTITGKLPPGAGKYFVDHALNQQSKHKDFVDEYNEPSAIIGKTDFARKDATAVYTFGVDTRDLVFHRHEGHRAISGITGGTGCLLKFSVCEPEDAQKHPEKFLEHLYIVSIPADRQFVLRFSGTIYHQFCPVDDSCNAFFAISVHTNEAGGLSGDLLKKVLSNEGNIPLLTEPAPDAALALMQEEGALKKAIRIILDIE